MNSSGDNEGKRKPPIDYLQLLKEQFSTLQAEHIELRRKYDLVSASPASSDSFPSRLLELIGRLQESDIFSDIKFIFHDGKTISSHRIVIEARTTFWKDLNEKSEIVLDKSTDYNCFIKVYRWMYSDTIDLKMGDVELLKVCEIACCYNLKSLEKMCIDQLSSRIDVQNCVLVYEFAEKQNLKELSDVCGNLISTSWNQFSSKHFASLTAPIAYKLIDRNTAHVLHSIVDIGREDVLFLYFMQKASNIPEILNELDENGATGLEKALVTAEEDGNTGIAEQLVEKGADTNVLDSNGDSILMRMIQKECTRASEFLLRNGCDGKLKNPAKGYNVLHITGQIQNPEIARWVLNESKHLGIDERDDEGMTPLMRAVENNNKMMVDVFLKAKSDVNLISGDGQSALSLCFFSKNVDLEIAKLLISNSADVNCKIKGSPILNEVIARRHIDSVSTLLNSGVDVNLIDLNGRSSLHIAAENSDSEILKKMFECRLREDFIWSRDNFDRSPLSYSIEKKDLDCAKILINSGADVNEIDESGCSLSANAIRANDDKTSVFLINNGAKPSQNSLIDGKSYIELSCELGLTNTVRALLSVGSCIEKRCSTGYSLLETALRNDHIDVATILIEHGCDIESRVRLSADDEVIELDSNDWVVEQTLLHHFIDAGNQKAAIVLIEAGCDVDCRKVYRNEAEDDHFTPSHMAVSWGQNDVLKALIEKGADLNMVDTDGRTPCHIGVREKNIEGVKVLLSSKSSEFISTRDKFGQTILSQSILNKDHKIAALIVERQPHAAVQTNGNGENLLHSAIRQNDLESVLFLLAVAKADATRPVSDGSNKTPLHLAAAVKNEMIVRNLILADEKINIQSVDGCTPLHDAIKTRNSTNASILLENGCDPTIKDEHGENALLCAMRSGSLDCLRIILADGRCSRYSQNSLGFTSLHICAMLTVEKMQKRTSSAELCELLLNTEEKSPNFNEKHFSAFIDAKDADGNTALMIAYSQGSAGVCRCLLRRRACMGTRNSGDVNIFTYETATKQLLLGLLESLEREPRWSDGENCDCGTKFSLTQRKHHCRHCGRHVCSKCSETTMPIAKYGEEKRVRVCDVCAHVISTGTAPRRI